MTNHDLDLAITKITTRATNAGGTWISGTINDTHRFEALVFADHAESEEYEIERSRISKLWIQHTLSRKTVFNFDRGLDVAAADAETQAMVEFLCEGLADLVYAD